MSRHECRWFHTGYRQSNMRVCKFCNKRYYRYDGVWKPEMSLAAFVDSWLPAISGTTPEAMMTVKVAFPFEFRCYESWGLAFRVRFHFHDVADRNKAGLGTPADVMNGWQSGWSNSWNEVDHEARSYFAERTGREFQVGDNTYAEMRRLIQS